MIAIRSGRMRWPVAEQTLEAGPADVIVTLPGTARSNEVVGDEPARVRRVDSPPTDQPDA